MNELQIFNSEEFGEIRTVTVDDEPMFCLVDICRALGLSQASKVKDRLKFDMRGGEDGEQQKGSANMGKSDINS